MPREEMIFHEMTPEDVADKVEELKAELFNLRFRNTMRQLDNPLSIRDVRRDIARCKTALAEHKMGLRTLITDKD
ncbi:MAG: 50S ribosomal protein L29 [Candidatus Eisenbacteria bacterium]|uniref:Large ribosomal subunit protein uL29 n=1 Tax=Eiseniibacteriota bacterium TaxID=2212470 RepID=A0A7Y2H0N9_UNCEI|nr:50S ribosomal protein L29 [Candidatus Eisenbacteria bacterium]